MRAILSNSSHHASRHGWVLGLESEVVNMIVNMKWNKIRRQVPARLSHGISDNLSVHRQVVECYIGYSSFSVVSREQRGDASLAVIIEVSNDDIADPATRRRVILLIEHDTEVE